jgi:hypothetical protein
MMSVIRRASGLPGGWAMSSRGEQRREPSRRYGTWSAGEAFPTAIARCLVLSAVQCFHQCQSGVRVDGAPRWHEGGGPADR